MTKEEALSTTWRVTCLCGNKSRVLDDKPCAKCGRGLSELYKIAFLKDGVEMYDLQAQVRYLENRLVEVERRHFELDRALREVAGVKK